MLENLRQKSLRRFDRREPNRQTDDPNDQRNNANRSPRASHTLNRTLGQVRFAESTDAVGKVMHACELDLYAVGHLQRPTHRARKREQ